MAIAGSLHAFPSFDARSWAAYAGQTVAVRAGQVIAVGADVRAVWQALRSTPYPDPEDCDYIVWVPSQAASYVSRFGEWEQAARQMHLEFNRRLRG